MGWNSTNDVLVIITKLQENYWRTDSRFHSTVCSLLGLHEYCLMLQYCVWIETYKRKQYCRPIPLPMSHTGKMVNLSWCTSIHRKFHVVFGKVLWYPLCRQGALQQWQSLPLAACNGSLCVFFDLRMVCFGGIWRAEFSYSLQPKNL